MRAPPVRRRPSLPSHADRGAAHRVEPPHPLGQGATPTPPCDGDNGVRGHGRPVRYRTASATRSHPGHAAAHRGSERRTRWAGATTMQPRRTRCGGVRRPRPPRVATGSAPTAYGQRLVWTQGRAPGRAARERRGPAVGGHDRRRVRARHVGRARQAPDRAGGLRAGGPPVYPRIGDKTEERLEALGTAKDAGLKLSGIAWLRERSPVRGLRRRRRPCGDGLGARLQFQGLRSLRAPSPGPGQPAASPPRPHPPAGRRRR